MTEEQTKRLWELSVNLCWASKHMSDLAKRTAREYSDTEEFKRLERQRSGAADALATFLKENGAKK